MGQLRFHKNLLLTVFLLTSSCGYEVYKYSGSMDLSKHGWLRGRKIFLDPGHGGAGKSDRFRVGPNNITEEAVNLRVALILEDMLRTSGADVKMSRIGDIKLSLDDRVNLAVEFRPELLISIHHNGSARKSERVNYPSVLIWGSNIVRPASYDFARYLQNELNGIMDRKGKIVSDFSIYSETGTRILRETRYLCPGALGEAGFFTDPDHSLRLKDIEYNSLEAEAYFRAISRYFKIGIPSAKILVSSKLDNKGNSVNMIKESKPVIIIWADSGNERIGIETRSLKITMNNIPVKFRKLSEEFFMIDYGRKLYPGGHSIRFQFKNRENQSSMVLSAPLTVDINKGDYHRLVRKGRFHIRRRHNVKEGLKMLLSAYSIDRINPEADRLLMDISRGFYLLGDYANSGYYYKKLFFFYPQSRMRRWERRRMYRLNSYRYPVDYYGKRVELIEMADIFNIGSKKNNVSLKSLFEKIKDKISKSKTEKKYQR